MALDLVIPSVLKLSRAPYWAFDRKHLYVIETTATNFDSQLFGTVKIRGREVRNLIGGVPVLTAGEGPSLVPGVIS